MADKEYASKGTVGIENITSVQLEMYQGIGRHFDTTCRPYRTNSIILHMKSYAKIKFQISSCGMKYVLIVLKDFISYQACTG